MPKTDIDLKADLGGDWAWKPGRYRCKASRDPKGGYGWTMKDYPDYRQPEPRPTRIGPAM